MAKKTSKSNSKPTVKEIVTQRLIANIEKSGGVWRKSWFSTSAPRSLVTKHQYTGINRIMLMTAGFGSPYWVTMKQVKDHDAFIKSDEMGNYETIIYPIPIYQKDENGDHATDEKGRKIVAFQKIAYTRVWNVEQLENVGSFNIPTSAETRDFIPHEESEKLFNNWVNAPRLMLQGDQPCYVPSSDIIRIPPGQRFHSDSEYYRTFWHEVGHAIRDSRRMNAQEAADYHKNLKSRAKEELVVEIFAAFMAQHLGISVDQDDENTAAYLRSWLRPMGESSDDLFANVDPVQVLKDNPDIVYEAASEAEKVFQYLFNNQIGAVSQSKNETEEAEAA